MDMQQPLPNKVDFFNSLPEVATGKEGMVSEWGVNHWSAAEWRKPHCTHHPRCTAHLSFCCLWLQCSKEPHCML